MSREQEIRAVKALGERIGYGNMMHIASGLWAISLEDAYGIDSGAFIPTIPLFLKKKESKRAIDAQTSMKAHIRKEISNENSR